MPFVLQDGRSGTSANSEDSGEGESQVRGGGGVGQLKLNYTEKLSAMLRSQNRDILAGTGLKLRLRRQLR